MRDSHSARVCFETGFRTGDDGREFQSGLSRVDGVTFQDKKFTRFKYEITLIMGSLFDIYLKKKEF